MSGWRLEIVQRIKIKEIVPIMYCQVLCHCRETPKLIYSKWA